jgi:hypothetical protein
MQTDKEQAICYNPASKKIRRAPVAHLDRVSVSEAEGSGFESRRARQTKSQFIELAFLIRLILWLKIVFFLKIRGYRHH